MKYIQGVPTCLPTGREDRRYYSQKPLMITFLPAGRRACPTAVSADRQGWNQLEFCLQSGQKSYFSHSLTFRAYLKSSEAVRVFSLTQTRYTLIMCRSHLFHTKLTLPVQTIIFVAPLLPFGHIFLSA